MTQAPRGMWGEGGVGRLIALGMVALVAAEAIWLLDVARTLTVDYFDAFEYLANARFLAAGGAEELAFPYQWRRPPLVPWLQSWWIPTDSGVAGALEALRRVHLLAWGLSVATLAVLFVHLRRLQGAALAGLGVFLLATNPMFLHMVPFALVDIPSALFTLLAIDAFARARNGGWGWGAAWCLFLAAAMLTKYNLLLLAPVFVVAEAVAPSDGAPLRARVRSARFALPLLGACALWYTCHVGLRFALEGVSAHAFTAPLQMLFGEVEILSSLPWDDPWYEYLQEVAHVSPALLLAAALGGFVLAVRRGDACDRIHLVWLLAFGFVMSFLVVSKTSRYFLPALPSLVFLQLRGLQWGLERASDEIERRWPQRRTLLRGAGLVALGVLVGWLPAQQAVHQLRHFDDPVYRSPFIGEVARAVAEGVPAGEAFHWWGRLYTLVPRERVFFAHDETFYFYHFGPPSLRALTNRPFTLWPRGADADAAGLATRLPDDALVVRSLPRLYLTADAADMPAELPPLQLDFVERRTLAPVGDTPRYEDGAARVELLRSGAGWTLPGVPGHGWRVLVRQPGGLRVAATGLLEERPEAIELVRVRSQRVAP